MQAVLEPLPGTGADGIDWDNPMMIRRRPPLITPAHIVGRCSTCHTVMSEGDLLCAHLASALGHQFAQLTDRPMQ